MRSWILHPLLFYPLALLIAGLVITVSLRPQSWPRDPAPVTAQVSEGGLTFAGAGFDAPAESPDQNMTVIRDFFGNALTLRVAVKPNQAPPTANDQGVRILITPEQAQMLNGRPVTVEVSYNPLPVNAAEALAVSLQGGGPANWVTQPSPPQPGTLRFDVPAQTGVNGVGLRAVAEGHPEAYGLEITRIRLIPHA